MRLLLVALFAVAGYFIWATTFAPLPPAVAEMSRDQSFEVPSSWSPM